MIAVTFRMLPAVSSATGNSVPSLFGGKRRPLVVNTPNKCSKAGRKSTQAVTEQRLNAAENNQSTSTEQHPEKGKEPRNEPSREGCANLHTNVSPLLTRHTPPDAGRRSGNQLLDTATSNLPALKEEVNGVSSTAPTSFYTSPKRRRLAADNTNIDSQNELFSANGIKMTQRSISPPPSKSSKRCRKMGETAAT